MSESIASLIDARVNSKDFTLPVFSPVAQEIQAAISKNANIDEIEKIILKDQSMAAEILRLANSAFFAGLLKQKTIGQALLRLGVNRVYNMVVAAAQMQSFQARHKPFDDLMKTLWQHAAASAAASRWVAAKCGYKEYAENAFLAGLLHDLGSLMVLKATDQIMSNGEAAELTPEVIHEIIDVLHCKYGHRIMESWDLPPQYAVIARDHHLKDYDPGNVLLAIVRLVDAVCAKVGIGLTHDPDIALEALPEAKSLGIKDVHLAELEIELEDFVANL